MPENNWKIGLIGELDKSKSISQINQDIESVRKSLKELELTAKLNPNRLKELKNQLDNLKVNLTDVSISPTTLNALIRQINSALSGIQISSSVIGDIKNNGNSTRQTNELEKNKQLYDDILTTIREIDGLKIKQTKLAPDIDTQQWEVLNRQISESTARYDELLNKFWSNPKNIDGLNAGDFSRLNSEITKTATTVEQLKAKMQDVLNDKATKLQESLKKAFDAQVSKIQFSLDNGTYDSKLSEITAKTQQWIDVNDRARISVDNLEKAYQGLINAKTPNELVDAEKRWQEELKNTNNEIRKRNAEYAKTSQVNAFHQQVQEWYDKNSAAHRKFGDQLQYILSKTKQGAEVTKTEMEQLKNEFTQLTNSARQAGKLGLSFFDSIKAQAKKFTQWVSVTSVVMSGVTQIKKMSQAVIEVNSAMIELKKVSDASNNEIKNYFKEATESAKDLGASISDIINATADFSRLGYNLSDSSKLARVATLYKNVGDGIDINESSSSIISTMKAFKISAEDSIEIVDKFNEVGNNFAISSGGIGEALKRSASSLAVAGNSISQSIGLITAGNTVVQDADKVGTALKTISLRMTSTSAELEQLGEDTEFACETLSDYRDLIMGLTHNKVDIVGDNGEYKATYQSLKEISEVWHDMNSMEQSALMKALFGVRQANIGASIIENFDIAEDAMRSAENAAGSALKEQQAYEEGIQFSLDRLAASYQELSNHILNSDLIKGIVDFGNTTINIIDNVIEKLGTLKTIGLGTALFAGFKNVGRANYISRPSLNVPTMISVL